MRGGFLARALFDVRRDERRLALGMATHFFLVITSFWILKPLKKTLFIGHYADSGIDVFGRHLSASEAELVAKILNMVVAAGAALAFALLARRFRRERLSILFALFFIGAYGLFALVLAAPTHVAVWSFYLFGDLFSTLMVAAFFAFLNDSVTPDAAKRLYGLIGFGGVAGGAFGSTAVAALIGALPLAGWLGVTALLGLLVIAIALASARELARAGGAAGFGVAAPAQAIDPRASAKTGSATTRTPGRQEGPSEQGAGLGVVLRSSYLLSIVAIVGLYEIVSTLVDFQFTTAIVELARDEAERNQAFATVYATTNWLSMSVQLFATSFVMKRLGMRTALLVLPSAIALASIAFSARPTLWLAGAMSVSDNAFSYSINQSSKEALYVPTTALEKYQAKAFIDMFVQRFAKAVAVLLGLFVSRHFGGTEGVRALTLVVLPMVACWSFAAAYAGRRFAGLEAERAGPGGGA